MSNDIKNGDVVRLRQPKIEGKVLSKNYNNHTNELTSRVQYTIIDGKEEKLQEVWFPDSLLEKVETEKEAEATDEASA